LSNFDAEHFISEVYAIILNAQAFVKVDLILPYEYNYSPDAIRDVYVCTHS
jgi:hypothetical protein